MSGLPNTQLRALNGKRWTRLLFAWRVTFLCLLAMSAALVPPIASATIIFETEANNSRATATPIADATFDFANTGGTAFRNATQNAAAPLFRTAGLRGTNSTASDVDYFSFTGTANELVYIDVDNDPAILCAPCNLDTALVLFNSTGAILAVADNNPVDAGSILTLDAFIGVFTLPTTDTYFLAIASGPLGVNIVPGTFTLLTRPDGLQGGAAIIGSPDDSTVVGVGPTSGGYLVWVSRSGVATSVPEPTTLVLFTVAGVAALMSRRRLLQGGLGRAVSPTA
jgi:hypothetical protein